MEVSNAECSVGASSFHPGVGPGVRSMSVAGCEDATVSERSFGLNRRRILKIATWNCGGLSFTTRELCKDLQYDILVLTETHNSGDLNASKNFIQSEQAPTTDSYSGVAMLLSDRVAKCVSHTQWMSRLSYCICHCQIQALQLVHHWGIHAS